MATLLPKKDKKLTIQQLKESRSVKNNVVDLPALLKSDADLKRYKKYAKITVLVFSILSALSGLYTISIS
jgi:hypothetical protein